MQQIAKKQTIAEWDKPDIHTFRAQILPRYQPAVLRGVVKDWPAIKSESPQQTCQYLHSFYNGAPITTWIGKPDIKGRFFYSDDLRGLNFISGKAQLEQTLTHLLHEIDNPEPHALYAGSVSLPNCFPGFIENNPLDLVDVKRNVNIWIGNAVTVSPHYDMSDNIACVVSGRRRFTLFPPEQLKNLYVGPLDFTPAGQPVSMVNLDAPDFEKYPLAKIAVGHALEAELEPGDAIYIPTLWWHSVKSLEKFNVLVNYWWINAVENTGSPFHAMIHSLMTISSLPVERRDAWREFFDHYVFQKNGNPAAHIPEHARGIMEPMTPELAANIQRVLMEKMR